MCGTLLTLKIVDRQRGVAEYVDAGSTTAKPVIRLVSGAQSFIKLVDKALHGVRAFAAEVDRLAAGVFVVHHDVDLVRLLTLGVWFHDFYISSSVENCLDYA